ncbi:MAG: hypothetical protein H7099_11675 [Gemmatimonadaceae bacterium]|nr:hypothetical protein [Gemmatimonadaceae bacterium]
MNPTRNSATWATIVTQLSNALDGAPPDTLDLVDYFFTSDPPAHRMRVVAHHFGTGYGALLSRFHRGGLPSPRACLADAMLVRAAFLLEDPRLSLSEVARRLRYSSPQAFHRTLHIQGHPSAQEFRRRYTGAVLLEHYLDRYLHPYRDAWRSTALVGPRLFVTAVAA